MCCVYMSPAMLVLGILSSTMLSSHAHGTSSHLQDSYNFHSVLHEKGGDMYTLHWRFDVEEETIAFAVNVSTNGWVGFGLSPNGGMKNSDMVIGWVKDGQPYLHDRYATEEALPAIDENENWMLENAEEVEGWTILEFSRKWCTSDLTQDRTIEADTVRVIYSWNDEDPETPATVKQHQTRGTVSINLLGGLQDLPPDPDDLKNFTVAADKVPISDDTDTTYWCVKYQLPTEVISDKGYITKYSTVLTPSSKELVHHILIYLCPHDENGTMVPPGHCEDDTSTQIYHESKECRLGVLIAAWAVGGQDFVYPEDVAYPIGGEGKSSFLLLEMHYNNPEKIPGFVDSSGIVLFYTSSPRKYDAAITTIGRVIEPGMLIPPNTKEFVIAAECAAQCTEKFFPEEGITVFANLLHTHVIGKEVELYHYRYSEACNGYQELAPIESNPTYDFNYQQANFLPKPVTVLPGDVLVIECVYRSDNRTNITLGGYSTAEEMCLAFPIYYPATSMGLCGSKLTSLNSVFKDFAEEYAKSGDDQKAKINDLSEISDGSDFNDALNPLTWDTTTVNSFQRIISNANHFKFCFDSDAQMHLASQQSQLVTPQCQYAVTDCIRSNFLVMVPFSCLCYNFLAFMTFSL